MQGRKIFRPCRRPDAHTLRLVDLDAIALEAYQPPRPWPTPANGPRHHPSAVRTSPKSMEEIVTLVRKCKNVANKQHVAVQKIAKFDPEHEFVGAKKILLQL